MADRLISADVLKSRVLQGQFKIGQDGAWYVLGLIDSTPTVEAEPIKHGRWVCINGWVHCSVCHQEPPNESNIESDYCPNCGAKMNLTE